MGLLFLSEKQVHTMQHWTSLVTATARSHPISRLDIAMKPSNVSLMKLSRVSSRLLQRKSVKSERRCFVTILNPSAPKVKRLQRNAGLEAQTPSVESEKISLLKKALEDFNLETQTLASHEASTITEEVQDLIPQDAAPISGEEVDSVSVSEKVE